jgi:serine protease
MRRTFQLCLSSVAAAVLLLATSAASDAHQAAAGTTYLKVKPVHAQRVHRTTSLLYSHGGAIEQAAKVYIVYWGPQWSTGFATGGYTSAQAQTYVHDFFAGVGGSSWANSTTQYCQGVSSGTTQCGSAGVHPSNPNNELAGTWNDTSSVPASPTQNQVAAEASALASHFGGVSTNADYMVFTPTGHSESGFGTNWCAYHSSSGNLSYSYMPYQPDAGTSCGMNFVNGLNTSYGNGYFDGFSIVGGHEYAETVTDPYPSSGWLDGRGSENGDKCAWISSGQGAASNVNLGGQTFAVQSLWSNAFNNGSGGCVLSY